MDGPFRVNTAEKVTYRRVYSSEGIREKWTMLSKERRVVRAVLSCLCAKAVQVLLLTRTKYDSCVLTLFRRALRIHFLKQRHRRGGGGTFPIKELLLL